MLEAKQLKTSVDGANGSFVYPNGTHAHLSVLMTSCHIADLEVTHRIIPARDEVGVDIIIPKATFGYATFVSGLACIEI